MLTDNIKLVEAALKNDGNFPIAVSNVQARKMQRFYTKEQQYDLDKRTCQNQIGVIINLSQELNTLMWDQLNNGAKLDNVDGLYRDICILNALSGIAIDAAKKEFNVNSIAETKELKAKYDRAHDGRQIKPNFFAAKDRGKGYYDPKRKEYLRHDTTMDYVQAEVASFRAQSGRQKHEFLPFSDLVTTEDYDVHRVWTDKVTHTLNLIREMRRDIRAIFDDDSYDDEKKYYLAALRRQECIEDIGEKDLTRNAMIYMLQRIESDRNKDIRATIFNTLFGYPNQAFFALIERSKTPVPVLIENEVGNVQLFDYYFNYSNYEV